MGMGWGTDDHFLGGKQRVASLGYDGNLKNF